MFRKIRLFLAKIIFPEIFVTAKFWKESYKLADEERGLLGFASLAEIESDWE